MRAIRDEVMTQDWSARLLDREIARDCATAVTAIGSDERWNVLGVPRGRAPGKPLCNGDRDGVSSGVEVLEEASE